MVERVRRQTVGDTLRRSRLRDPNKLALKWKETEMTYHALDERVNQLANGLVNDGVKKGDRVAIMATNCIDFVVVHFAVARTGAIFVPINFMLHPDGIQYILEHSEPMAIFTTPNRLDTVTTALQQMKTDQPALKMLIDTTADSDWMTLTDYIVDQPTDEPDILIEDTDVVNILYTSGTESRPKGVMLTHQNLITEYVSCIVDFHFAREVVTQFFCPPTIWIGMIRHPDFRPEALAKLKKCYFGASATPMEVLKEAGKILPHVRFWNTYGQTEVAPFATVLQPEEQLAKIGTVGRPCLNMETKIVDDDGNEVPNGQFGEIVHRSPHVMTGYYLNPEKNKEVFQGEWFHSGDLGFFDDDGFLTVVDRKKDMIKTGGENVASLEVEEMIYQHPDVSEVSVISVPHPYWTEAVTAIIIAKPDKKIDTENITAFCKERLAGFKVPKYFVEVESFPKNPSGKILKRELREEFKELAAKMEPI